MNDARIPVTLLTGFLGSGKTTLLNAALAEPDCPRIGVVVNEFGSVGVDQALVEAATDEVVLLAGGCACCSVRADLADALARLERAARERSLQPFERVLIETTGLADPTPIEQLFLVSGPLAARYRLDAIVTVVDAVLGARTADREPVWSRQVALADRIVMSKTDVATSPALSAVRTRLDAVNPGAFRIVDASRRCAVASLFGRGPGRGPERHGTVGSTYAPVHDEGIRAHIARVNAPLAGATLGSWLDTLVSFHGERLLRLKGLVRLAEDERPLVVHAAQHFIGRPTFLDAWPGADRTTRLAFVTQGLEPIDLAAGYAGPREALTWL